jgi:aspartyl-tRNA(Asn)/glutamyl-tRNA(Gln) amidotransferase subunit A
VSLEGVFPRLYSLDHVGTLTRTVADCAIALQLIAGHDSGDTTTARKAVPDFSKDLRAGVQGMKIGVDRGFTAVGQPDVLVAFGHALDTLRSLGAEIVELSFSGYDDCIAVGNTIGLCEEAVSAVDLYRAHPADFENNRPPATPPADIKAGLILPAVDYIRATQHRRVLQAAFARASAGVAVLVAPSCALAPRPYGDYPRLDGRQYTADDVLHYTFPFDVLGVPALSVPCGFSRAGSPIGMQFIARPFEEGAVLRAAYAYEQATEWHTRRPAMARS